MWLMKTLISVTNKQGMHCINRFKPWDLSQPPLHSDHKENMEFDTVVLKNLYRICNMKRSSTHKITFFHQHQIAYQAVLQLMLILDI